MNPNFLAMLIRLQRSLTSINRQVPPNLSPPKLASTSGMNLEFLDSKVQRGYTPLLQMRQLLVIPSVYNFLCSAAVYASGDSCPEHGNILANWLHA